MLPVISVIYVPQLLTIILLILTGKLHQCDDDMVPRHQRPMGPRLKLADLWGHLKESVASLPFSGHLGELCLTTACCIRCTFTFSSQVGPWDRIAPSPSPLSSCVGPNAECRPSTTHSLVSSCTRSCDALWLAA